MHLQLHINQSLVVRWSDDWKANFHVCFAHCNVVKGSASLVLCCQSKHKVATRCLIAFDSISLDNNIVRIGIEQILDSCIIKNRIAIADMCATPKAIYRHFIICHERLRHGKIESAQIFTDALQSELPIQGCHDVCV